MKRKLIFDMQVEIHLNSKKCIDKSQEMKKHFALVTMSYRT